MKYRYNISDIKALDLDSCIAEIHKTMLAGSARTDQGFEAVLLHPTYSVRYSLLLPYGTPTIEGLVYRRTTEDSAWHSLAHSTPQFARSILVLLYRNHYSRITALNADAQLPPIASSMLAYLAAGYTVKETTTALSMSERAGRTAVQKILNEFAVRSVPEAVARYILLQSQTITKDSTTNPYSTVTI